MVEAFYVTTEMNKPLCLLSMQNWMKQDTQLPKEKHSVSVS